MDPLEAIHLYYMIKHDTKNPNKLYYMGKVNGCCKDTICNDPKIILGLLQIVSLQLAPSVGKACVLAQVVG